MANRYGRVQKEVLIGVACFPLIAGAWIASAMPPGGGNPACLLTEWGLKACSTPKGQDNDGCDDTYVSDGDCPKIFYRSNGLTGPPITTVVVCKWYENKPKVGGGCELDLSILFEYHAICQTANGTVCP